MSPVTGLARLPGRILWSVHMGNFSPVGRDEFKKHNQNGGTKTCIARDCHSFADSCNFINKAISQSPEVEIHTRPKLYHFGRYLVKAKLFCLKCFVLVTGLECSYGENFHPGYRPHMNTSIFLQRKEWRGEISETEPVRLTGLI